MSKIIVMAAITVALAGCSDPEAAQKALEGAGYTDIQLGGYSVFGCGKDDTYATEFKAKGPTGKPVEGVVCSGWLKGATIRSE